jgi:hypothetical protein
MESFNRDVILYEFDRVFRRHHDSSVLTGGVWYVSDPRMVNHTMLVGRILCSKTFKPGFTCRLDSKWPSYGIHCGGWSVGESD